MTFSYDYEALCAAMAMVDAAISQVEDLAHDDDYGWVSSLNTIRNEMNDARLSCIHIFGPRVFHVDDIAAARQAPAAAPTPQGE